MRVLELFGGYGSQALALENLGYDFTSDLCEIDKYAIQAYNQLHGETKNWGDICKIDETQLPYYDLITYSSPCQDFSQAGKQAGGEKGSGTRSSLLWECERIIRAVKPKYLLMENVKALTSKKFMPLFANWLRTLESIGYQNWWKVLNAKDYGVPQNRERVFVVSILGGGHYQFPEPIPLTKRLKDVLEPVVDEKYYLSDKIIQGFLHRQETNNNGFAKNGINIRNDKEYATALTARMAKCGMTDNYVMDVSKTVRCGGRGTLDKKHYWDVIAEPVCCASRGRNPDNPRDRTTGAPTEQRIEINTKGTSNTITTVEKDNYVIEPKITEYRFFEQAIKTAEEKDAKNGDTIDAFNQRVNNTGVCPTLTTRSEGFKTAIFPVQNYRIRKLTPRECWRLMGVKDEQFDKIHDISNSQLYKMAGNSIVVDVLMAIFKNMFEPTEQKGQMNLL